MAAQDYLDCKNGLKTTIACSCDWCGTYYCFPLKGFNYLNSPPGMIELVDKIYPHGRKTVPAGCQMIKINVQTKFVNLPKPSGMNCYRCQFYNEYAEANRPNGYLCFNCR